jgi:S-phase kinase-associated protein 1
LQDADLGVLVQAWYADFIERTNNDILFKLTLAANYLDIKPLLDLCCARIASFIKGKTPEEIRTNLGIVVDFTPEEEAQVRAENSWADDLH